MPRKVKKKQIKGTVKWFNDEKGLGFITSEADLNEYLVHYSSIRMDHFRTLKAGQVVFFEADTTYQLPQAVNVQPVPEGRRKDG